MKRRWSVLSSSVALAAGMVGWSPQALAADPTTGDCLAASEASLKSGNEHHLRTERNQLLVCAAASCPADIRKECVRRVDEVNTAIPTIIFEAKDGSGKDLSAVKVTMDGDALAERLEGSALSIDPGEHTFAFATEGQPPLTKVFVIRESEKDRREAITFGVGDVVSSPLQAGAEASVTTGSTGLGTQKILAIVAGGVGVVGLGVGTAFGLVTMSKKSDAQKACPNLCADPNGVSLWSDAKSAGNVSTVAFIVGGVALAGGAALWFTAKPESRSGPSAQVGVGPGSLQLKGVW
jgi:hypothetical protein